MVIWNSSVFKNFKKRLILALIVLSGIIIITVGVALYLTRPKSFTGAVVTNGKECAKIGTSILKKGGSAVDAAIAALFCDGISMPQSMGIGGGFLMTVYIKEKNKAYFINARETAPQAATKDMYVEHPELSSLGILSAAVPGELRGYWWAYKKFGGKIPWKELVQPTIDLCINGIEVTEYYDNFLKIKSARDKIFNSPGLKSVFVDPATNDTWKLGQRITYPQFAKTLEIISKEGGDALHNGSLTESFVKEIRELGGIITLEDMKNYKPIIEDPVTVELPESKTLYTSTLPGSGVVLSFILNILKNYIDVSDLKSVTNWQRIAESFKFAYAKRSELGDLPFVPNIRELVSNLTSDEYAREIRKKIIDTKTFSNISYYGASFAQPEDHGTAHLSVLASNGDAVSVTSTVNLYFGGGVMLEKSGIILNNEMDDFSTPGVSNNFGIPPSEANFIEPNKRPLSSMVPTIIVDKNNNVELIVGAAGGSKITTSVALIIIRHLWFNQPIANAVNDGRIHHQLLPMLLQMEPVFINSTIAKTLETFGHNVSFATDGGFSAATAVSTRLGVDASFDKRRQGDYSFL